MNRAHKEIGSFQEKGSAFEAGRWSRCNICTVQADSLLDMFGFKRPGRDPPTLSYPRGCWTKGSNRGMFVSGLGPQPSQCDTPELIWTLSLSKQVSLWILSSCAQQNISKHILEAIAVNGLRAKLISKSTCRLERKEPAESTLTWPVALSRTFRSTSVKASP